MNSIKNLLFDIGHRVKRLKSGPALFVAGFTLIGVITVIYSFAATSTVATEAELGSLQGGAAIVTDSSASGGQSVRFEAASASDPWPAQDSFAICGDASILNGPTAAPSGAITVNPGTDLAAATASKPSGTTFYLTAGTHTLAGPIIVKANNKYIGAPGAILDGQFRANDGARSLAFKGGSAGVTVQYLTIKNFGQSDGKMAAMINQSPINWSQGQHWTISNNTIAHNGGAGVWVSSNSRLQNNCIEDNEQTGVAVPSTGSTTQTVNPLIEHNEIRNNNPTNAIEAAGVCTGCAGGIKIWNSKGAIVRNNRVTDNNGAGIWVDNNNIDTLIEGNVSKDNLRYGIFLEISYDAIIQKNYVSGNYVRLGPSAGSYPHSGIYISESGGDQATKTLLGGTFAAEVDINNNYIVDNWNGINLWENAGRYCTQNDTSNCPPAVTDETGQCATNLSANADVCRWKTQFVKVHDNRFEMTAAARNSWCPTTNANCGRNALQSNTGPSGTPYAGAAIQTAISQHQNNTFYDNSYVGGWKFSVPSSSAQVQPNTWQQTWDQDTNSLFK
jgi:parallel beta-helix repeat protein